MPELPEVETVRRGLVPWLTGRTIRAVRRVDAPPSAKYADLERAAGQRIVAVHRRGKFLLLPLSGGDEIVIHLGMTGVISAERPRRHLRLVLALSGRGDRALYFADLRRFGRFLLVAQGDYARVPMLGRLGPEPLHPSFTPAALHAALAPSRSTVKALLLSQRPVAGLGNIYVDEALWHARLHPATIAGHVDRRRVAALHRAVVTVIEAAIAAEGTTFSDYRTVAGEPGRYLAALAVYGRAGEPCRRCGATIRKTALAQRGTHFCPRCQRPPRSRGRRAAPGLSGRGAGPGGEDRSR
jgi:formamidopyrimidine-DNA glycosylase